MSIVTRTSGLPARAAALAAVWAVLAAAVPAEDVLKVESAVVSPLRLARGEEGKLVLRIAVPSGIAVSALPSFTVEIGPNEELVFPKNFFTAADLSLELVEIGGKEYVSLQKPIVIPFTVNPKAKRGVHVLQGRVKYFACSLKDGWCLKSAAKFSATFSTRTTPIRETF
jgi:hypothetical protein